MNLVVSDTYVFYEAHKNSQCSSEDSDDALCLIHYGVINESP